MNLINCKIIVFGIKLKLKRPVSYSDNKIQNNK